MFLSVSTVYLTWAGCIPRCPGFTVVRDNGRPGIDPEVAVRLMLAGFVLGLVQDRRLMLREAQVNLAIRWFAGYGLHEALGMPDHSSLTRIRQRWGADPLFRKVFMRIVQDCAQAGLITAETVHMDASLIRADVSMDGPSGENGADTTA